MPIDKRMDKRMDKFMEKYDKDSGKILKTQDNLKKFIMEKFKEILIKAQESKIPSEAIFIELWQTMLDFYIAMTFKQVAKSVKLDPMKLAKEMKERDKEHQPDYIG